MIYVVCVGCNTAMSIESSDESELDHLVGKHSPFFPNKYPCPRACGPEVSGMALQVGEITGRALGELTVVEVTPQEAFVALHGLGFPQERSCYFEEVSELLLKSGVKRLVGRNLLGTTRALLDGIELNDGTMIHIGAGTEGATIYRVTRPPAYARRLLEKTNA